MKETGEEYVVSSGTYKTQTLYVDSLDTKELPWILGFQRLGLEKGKYGWIMCSAGGMKAHYLSVNMTDGEDSGVVLVKMQGLSANQPVRTTSLDHILYSGTFLTDPRLLGVWFN